MADPEQDFGMAYDEQGYVHILHSTFFDVDPEVDHTLQGYVERILDTLVDAVEEQLGTVEWRIAADPNFIKIPEKINWEDKLPKSTPEWEAQMAVSKLFEERPIWARWSLHERWTRNGYDSH
ncbi:hypothetical protein M5K25_014197 [Dendrobium thyrsiflorum]|uniref:Uncharacterized protein n=1 Tax=Dendrobium thyrsiflorum TaxID=117978 RepID=A0ABD0UUV1_DENTH